MQKNVSKRWKPKDLLEKFHRNTITREEFDQLAEMVNNKVFEGEIENQMKEHWAGMDLSCKCSPFDDKQAEIYLEELLKRIGEGGKNT